MRVLSLVLAMGVVTACSSAAAGTSPSTSADTAHRFTDLLQAGVSYDYEPFDSPIAQKEAADLVVVGTIADVVPGRVLPYGRSANHANLVVDVQEVVSGTPGAKKVYVEVQLGSGVRVAEVRKLAPTARLILFLDDRTDQKGVDGEAGRPTGASIYAPYIQGMIVEAGDDWVSVLVDRTEMTAGWSDSTSFDAFLISLKQ